MTIAEALTNIGCPVCHPPFEGKEKTYITYQLVGQVGTIYAEGKEARTGVNYSVDVWSDAPCIALMLAAKAALEVGGYIAVVDMEHYDNETRRYHLCLSATIAGAVYG